MSDQENEGRIAKEVPDTVQTRLGEAAGGSALSCWLLRLHDAF